MPNALNFKTVAVDPILAGVQRLTLRRANSGYQRGDVVKAVVRGKPAFAELRIVKVETLALGELTRAHAKRAGQRDVEALRESALAVYPDDREFDAITFERTG